MTDTRWASTAEQLAELRVMNATLTSGARVSSATMTLDELVTLNAFPDDLVYIAVLENAGATIGEMAREIRDGGDKGAQRVKDMSRHLLELRDRLCIAALEKSGAYADGEAATVMASLDGYDKAFLADLVQRKRNEDAAGRRFGAETLGQFRGDAPEPAGAPDSETRGDEELDVPDVQP